MSFLRVKHTWISIWLFNSLDLGSSNGKLQNRNGKKRENNVVPKSTSGGASAGPSTVGFKNPKPCLPKPKGSDKKQQRTNVGFAGSGAHRKNDHQVPLETCIY